MSGTYMHAVCFSFEYVFNDELGKVHFFCFTPLKMALLLPHELMM